MDESSLLAFLTRLHACWKKREDSALDVVGLIDGLLKEGVSEGDIKRTAKTILKKLGGIDELSQ